MPPQGFRVGDRIRLPDGQFARIVADRPERIDRRAQVCFLRERHGAGEEETQYESLPVEVVARA